MLNELQKFSDENFVNQWFSDLRWPDGQIFCPRCQGSRTRPCTHLTMPFWCADCRNFFSLKFGTALQFSRISLNKWAIATIHDLRKPEGIVPGKLSKKIKINRECARSMLGHIGNALITDNQPEEFKFGKFFRFDEILYEGQKLKNVETGDARASTPNSSNFIVICITDFKSNKVWIEVVHQTKLNTVSGIVKQILPKGACIFTDHNKYYDDINKKFRVRKKSEFEGFDNARMRKFGLESSDKLELAETHLESGLAGVYHKMTLEKLRFFTKTFTGRWNIQEYSLTEQVQLVFSAILNNNNSVMSTSAKNK